jgi:hypothetical protein
MKYFIFIFFLFMFIFKPSNFMIKEEISLEINSIIHEVIYDEFEKNNVIIDPISMILIPEMIDHISEEATTYLKIKDLIFIKLIYNNSEELIGCGFLGNVYTFFSKKDFNNDYYDINKQGNPHLPLPKMDDIKI